LLQVIDEYINQVKIKITILSKDFLIFQPSLN